MDTNISALSTELKRLHSIGSYSDLTIECGPEVFHVHKAKVCKASTYFARACAENRWKEGYQSIIILQAAQDEDEEEYSMDDDPAIVKAMITCVYLDTYDAETNGKPADCYSALALHVKLYAMGDKYDVPSVKDRALERFSTDAAKAWNSAEFIQATELAYTTTPDSDQRLRHAAAEVIYRRSAVLSSKPEFEALVQNLDGLAYNIWKLVRVRESGPTCNVCHKVCIKTCEECIRSEDTPQFITCACSSRKYCSTDCAISSEIQFHYGRRH